MLAAQSNARSAHRWLAGPAWATAEQIPWLGRPARVGRGLADVAVSLAADALPPAVRAEEALTPSHLRTPDGAIRLDVFRSAADPLAVAATAADDAARAVAKLPGSSWLPSATHARRSATSQIDELSQVLQDARNLAQIAPQMLGGSGTRRYLLVVQNEAEARGLGGLPGELGVVTATDGKLAIGKIHNNGYLTTAPAYPVPLGRDYRQTYAGTDVMRTFGDSNVSPHFPNVAPVWLAMWQERTGERLDGAIATDPTALSYLLRATGPAHLSDGTTVSSGNVVTLTERTVYSRFSDAAERNAFFGEVARAAVDRVVAAPHGSSRALVSSMHRAVVEHRLIFWSAHDVEQATLSGTPLAGALPRTRAPFVGVTLNDAQGSKLGYYIHRSITYARGSCVSSGHRATTVTVRLRNTAPPNLPGYVTKRVAGPIRSSGSAHYLVALYATQGSQLLGVTVDGARVLASAGVEVAHPRFEIDAFVDPGATSTVVLHLLEPPSSEPVQIWKQPGVLPESVTVTGTPCD